MYARNQYCNLFPLCRAISLFAIKAHVAIYRVGSRLAQCTPYSTVHTALESMAAAKCLFLRTNPLKHDYFVVLDNIQAYSWWYDPRIGTANAMLTETGASTIVMEDCSIGAFDVQPYLDQLAKCERKELTVEKIHDSIDWTHIDAIQVSISSISWFNMFPLSLATKDPLRKCLKMTW